MAYDLGSHLAPDTTAVLVFECQEGVIGKTIQLPGLANAVEAGRVVANIAGLLASARAAGARVFYCTVGKRPDGIGNPFNTPIEQRLRAQNPELAGGPDLGGVVEALAPQADEVVVRREHGLTGFYESGLDAFLRNTQVRSIVLTGVSVNIGILGTAIEAVNRGYTVIVPSDCVAGDPPAYAEQALRYSVRNVAFLTTSAEVAAIWDGAANADYS
jgi:nicotinamidase-related amidase